jgi:hypothetical protein
MYELRHKPVSALPPNVEHFLVDLYKEIPPHKPSNGNGTTRADDHSKLSAFAKVTG